MKVLLSWLREFAPDIDGDPEHLGEVLSDLGLAVEELSHVGQGLDGIVVAEVLATRPHPDADRIHLVDVDAGDGEALQVCCGAFNMAVGDLGASGHGGHHHAQRHGDRPPQDAGPVEQRDAVLRGRDRHGRRP